MKNHILGKFKFTKSNELQVPCDMFIIREYPNKDSHIMDHKFNLIVTFYGMFIKDEECCSLVVGNLSFIFKQNLLFQVADYTGFKATNQKVSYETI